MMNVLLLGGPKDGEMRQIPEGRKTIECVSDWKAFDYQIHMVTDATGCFYVALPAGERDIMRRLIDGYRKP
jgi:hypothetical protein